MVLTGVMKNALIYKGAVRARFWGPIPQLICETEPSEI